MKLLKTLSFVVALGGVLTVAGCTTPPAKADFKGGQATGMINAYAQATITNLDAALKFETINKPLIEASKQNQLNIQGQTKLIEKWFEDATAFGQKWFWCIGAQIERAFIRFSIVVIIFWVIGLGLTVGALFVTGPFGAPMSFVGHGITSTIPWAGAWVNELATNLHFRGVTPSGAKPSPPPTKK